MLTVKDGPGFYRGPYVPGGIRANGEGCDRGLNGVETEGLSDPQDRRNSRAERRERTRQGEGRRLAEVLPAEPVSAGEAGQQLPTTLSRPPACQKNGIP
jgi:hypothetical protein